MSIGMQTHTPLFLMYEKCVNHKLSPAHLSARDLSGTRNPQEHFKFRKSVVVVAAAVLSQKKEVSKEVCE